jgi:hypothetical protein
MFSSISTIISTPPLIISDKKSSVIKSKNLQVNNNILGYYTSWKRPVRIATTEQINLFGLQIIDGIQLLAGNRVLVKDQPNIIDNDIRFSNGIYNVTTTDWYRSDDCQARTSSDGLFVYVADGDMNKERYFISLTVEGIIGAVYIPFLNIGVLQQPVGISGAIQYNNLGNFEGNSYFLYSELDDINLMLNKPTNQNKIMSSYVISPLISFNIKSGLNNNGGAGGDINILTGDSSTQSGSITIESGSSNLSQSDSGNMNILANNLNIEIKGINTSDEYDITFATGTTTSSSVNSGIFINTNGYLSMKTVQPSNGDKFFKILGDTFYIDKVTFVNTITDASTDSTQGFIDVTISTFGSIAASSSAILAVFNPYVFANSVILTNVQNFTGTGNPTMSVSGITFISDYNVNNQFFIKISNVNTTTSITDGIIRIGYIIL